MYDTLKIAVDSLQKSGFLGVSWEAHLYENIFYICLGLFFTWLYYFTKFKKSADFPNSWKELFKDPKHSKTFITSIIFYLAFIFIWMVNGGAGFAEPIKILGVVLGDVFPFIKDGAEKLAQSLLKSMPKTELNWSVIIPGYTMTSLITKWGPALFNFIKSKFTK